MSQLLDSLRKLAEYNSQPLVRSIIDTANRKILFDDEDMEEYYEACSKERKLLQPEK